MTGSKLEGTSAGEIAPHTKTEPGKNGLATALLIKPTVIQRSTNLLLNCNQAQKRKKSKTAREHFLTASSSPI